MTRSAPRVARPADRWLASADDPNPLPWRASTRDAVNYCRIRGDKFLGLYATEAEARAARMSSHERATSTEQSEALAGGLVASQSMGIVGTLAGATKKRRVA